MVKESLDELASRQLDEDEEDSGLFESQDFTVNEVGDDIRDVIRKGTNNELEDGSKRDSKRSKPGKKNSRKKKSLSKDGKKLRGSVSLTSKKTKQADGDVGSKKKQSSGTLSKSGRGLDQAKKQRKERSQ